MSPEQARGLRVDGRTDIFSLGAVIYEILTCRKPFYGETPSHVVVAILEKEPLPVSEISPGIPADLENVVHKALQKDRQARYQTAAELIEDLKNVRQMLEMAGPSRHDLKSRRTSLAGGARSSDNGMGKPPRSSAGKIDRQTLSATNIISEINHRRRSIAVVTIAVIVAVTAAVLLSSSGAGQAINSVAILPFINVNSDESVEYLSDGIADQLTNSLSRLPGLTVISSSAASRYKARDPRTGAPDVQAVGRELKVQAVVFGNVAQQGSRIHVHAELIDVRNNGHLWGEQYDRNATDILSVQDAIVKGISEKLRSSLTRKEESQLSKRHTESNQAYQSYLRGRYAWNKRTEPDLRKAIDFFDEAIGADPRYALAYSGLADTYQMFVFHGGLSPNDYCPKARAAAERAIEIDDTLAEAHCALAYVKFYYDWDWSGAQGEFKRAIELNPNYATAHQWYGEYLGNMGRPDESLAEREKALNLDPLSPIITSELGNSYFEARKYDRALEEFRKAAELYPDFSPAHSFLAMACEWSGLYDEAIAECQKAITLANDPNLLVQLAQIFAMSGR